MAFDIAFDGDDGTDILDEALRYVARYYGVVDLQVHADRIPDGVVVPGSAVVTGVGLDGTVQLHPWSEQLGDRDPAAEPVVIPISAIYQLHIY